MKRIFEPLFTTKERGTGLGLSICKTLLDEEGGTLEVDSKLGRGSVFRVKLRAATSDTREQQPLTVRSHGKRILIVEDEARLATTLQHLLDVHTVAIASSGRAALDKLLAGEKFDLILCDLVMPDVDGPELYRKVREGWAGLGGRFVFLSSSFESSTRCSRHRRAERVQEFRLWMELARRRVASCRRGVEGTFGASPARAHVSNPPRR